MRFHSFLLSALLCGALAAQVPQAFDFQAVARDASGNVLSAQPVSVRLSVHSGAAGGAIVYQETHAVTTNAFGLFSVAVGQGSTVQGVFADVSWGGASHFLQVELDASGGSNYLDMGTTQLLSVPYALHAGGVDCPTVSLLGDTLKQANGCFVIIPGVSAANGGCADADNDGFYNNVGCPPLDCDDTDPNVHPGGTEICGTGEDEDCDGVADNLTDPAAFVLWYTDADTDGFGNSDASTAACAQPAGTVSIGGDCDDTDPAIFPGQNCSTTCTAAEIAWLNTNFLFYRESLLNAWGNCFFEQGGQAECIQTTLEALGIPLSEACNSCGIAWAQCVEQNCLVACLQGPAQCQACAQSSNCTAGMIQCFGLMDADNDGVPAGSDCDDADNTVYNGAPELCDTKDNDCDGMIDEGNACCPDADSDGFSTCDGDCDDNNLETNPGAPEQCADGIDNNCDGQVDEACADADGDGFTEATDCDDTNAAIFPGATELLNTIDDDCDGDVDEDFADTDADGFTPVGGDCDDGDASVFPGAFEVCGDGRDNDCDGAVDNNTDPGLFLTWYMDADGDGHGDASSSVSSCVQVAGTVPTADDCDDADPNIHPGGIELCDALDNDCDGQVDEAPAADAPLWYMDADGDGHGDPSSSVSSCVQVAGTVPSADDCDDADPSVHPGASEIPNGTDDDCDGAVDEGSAPEGCNGIDDDGDGLIDAADPSLVLVPCENQLGVCNGAQKTSNMCVGGAWLTCTATSYDMGSPVFEVVEESCDTQDNDCDGLVDEEGVCP